LAIPDYKGLTAVLPCSDDDDDDDDDEEDDDDDDNDDDDGCEFDDDEDDDDGDGTSDEPASGQDVISQGVAISKTVGTINLKQSMLNGALGANPANGTSQTFRIYYRLNDNSQKALNYIDVKLHYFRYITDVPQSLINLAQQKNQNVRLANKNLRIKEAFGKRPPDIIIVGRFAEE
jgi:cobalamin biosynthesis protein CobT